MGEERSLMAVMMLEWVKGRHPELTDLEAKVAMTLWLQERDSRERIIAAVRAYEASDPWEARLPDKPTS